VTDHEAAIAALAQAPFDDTQWMVALDRIAAATGSRMGQLIGWISDQRPPLNLLTDTLPVGEDEWLEAGGVSTKANPLMRAGARLPAMTTILDVEVCFKQSQEERTLWGAFFDPCDVPHMGAVVLTKDDGDHFALAMMRRRREGPLLDDQKWIFEDCARAAQQAAQLSKAFGESAASVLNQGLEAVGSAALAFNGAGKVVTITSEAEHVLRNGHWFDVSRGQLRSPRQSELVALTTAVATTLHTATPTQIRLQRPGRVLTIRLTPLSTQIGLYFSARVLAVLQEARIEVALTAAERAVLDHLREGRRASLIAEERQVSIETVRSQIKAIYQKLGVTSHVELIKRG
jgi:DNA-binding CsgD family transcriptional regulator